MEMCYLNVVINPTHIEKQLGIYGPAIPEKVKKQTKGMGASP